mgnify:CR=1 FL=1
MSLLGKRSGEMTPMAPQMQYFQPRPMTAYHHSDFHNDPYRQNFEKMGNRNQIDKNRAMNMMVQSEQRFDRMSQYSKEP